MGRAGRSWVVQGVLIALCLLTSSSTATFSEAAMTCGEAMATLAARKKPERPPRPRAPRQPIRLPAATQAGCAGVQVLGNA